MAQLGNTDLDVFPLCLGGNVFGWTADREQSFAVLDTYLAAGGNFVDTADVYSTFVPGNAGGESEQVLGEWLRARGNRDDVLIATKVGMWEQRPGLSAANITAAAEDSLRRLGTDHIDLYYAHHDDADTPLEEALTAFDGLVRSGKVRHIAASNYSAARLQEALSVSRSGGLAEFAALQPHYNLVERADFEGELSALVEREGLGVLPYYALAKGFLTGKYRPGDDTSDSPRAEGARAYLDERGVQVLAALDEIALVRGVPLASVALAWLAGKPGVTAPIASARNLDQLQPLLTAAEIRLSAEEMQRLDDASR
ncbi:aldo/keto reductase [Saccharopolyspora sp. HNM0983]|uniref:Aldo/keto reductase n=1 Tax=Saccharopolyspora montiporae TaxID=2781240 RepID=A0A929B6D8_9PSEU|nr:aldo/keto reductase [Saccharopolyspora sp. HNM0983]MBE9374014.1 aldo/keto reductase [Saccharopolyspora sp. HNM0983]